jgi:sulfur-oxidizing protein SoxY
VSAKRGRQQGERVLVYSMWEPMRALLIPSEPMEFASRVPVNAPANAEDWLNVPVIVDATTLPGVAETIVFGDQKTVSRILNCRPLGARPVIGLRIRVQQTTPCVASRRPPNQFRGRRLPRAGAHPCRSGLEPPSRRDWGTGLTIARRSPDHCSAAAGQFYGTARLPLQIRYPITASLAGGSPAYRDGSCPPV